MKVQALKFVSHKWASLLDEVFIVLHVFLLEFCKMEFWQYCLLYCDFRSARIQAGIPISARMELHLELPGMESSAICNKKLKYH